ncbi:subtilisin-like protease SBT4.3 [Asparagus officinalis]|uniref:subtilisin-like protease SBT4.3 n=1 Tax=Asparagus officinalis TaxID=4686 RepID=UPI00098E235D|nr:subtilisin-like protease SBT4.3 [Asparagus officinalis]
MAPSAVHLFRLCIAVSIIVLPDTFAAEDDRQIYIAYMGEKPKLPYRAESVHLSLLDQVLEGSSVKESLVYSYSRSFNGFAAKLTAHEYQRLADMEGIVSVFPSKTLQLHTTRSWDFLGFSETATRHSPRDSDIIIGMIDTGIWPESASFSDEGFGAPPNRWRGICRNFTCNNKIIGARYYYSIENAKPDTEISARDFEGHGTHTTSTVAGREVHGMSLYGIAKGTARGAAPSSRIAVYKVCWGSLGCAEQDVLAAFDDAIADGVDIISASIGKAGVWKYFQDSVAIGSFHAMKAGILTACEPQSLDGDIVKGKVVLCDARIIGDEPLLAGAKGAVMVDYDHLDLSWPFPLPAVVVDANEGDRLRNYINSTGNPMANIHQTSAVIDGSAPMTASFSSRGPNLVTPDILKPDVSAPGLNILAAWSPEAPISGYANDKRSVQYNIMSGTSASCPHATGVAAYVKSFHPNFSPAALLSAIMTTAKAMDPNTNPDAELAYGSGQINPLKATDPGLVYDAGVNDYINFLCSSGYSADKLRLISGDITNCSKSSVLARDLNYPSMAFQVNPDTAYSVNFSRTVTNVGSVKATYKAAIQTRGKIEAIVHPDTLSFEGLNEKQSFVVSASSKEGIFSEEIASASLIWSDGVHSVRSPIVIHTGSMEYELRD